MRRWDCIFAALSSHEIAISHDAKRVYSGLGFAVAYIENLEQPDTWTVKNWSCEMNKQSGFPADVPNACEGPSQQDVGRQYSHSSDDNLEGTVWYGANQEGSSIANGTVDRAHGRHLRPEQHQDSRHGSRSFRATA